MQISDNPELFQPVGEEFIMQANSGQFINDQLWGQSVRVAFLQFLWCLEHFTWHMQQRLPCRPGPLCLHAALTDQSLASSPLAGSNSGA